MKKIILSLFVISMTAPLFAEHTTASNASNLTKGILPNARLDPSSVTLQGNANFPSFLLDNSSITKLGPTVPTTALTGQVQLSQVAFSVGVANQNKIATVFMASNAALSGTADVLSDFTTGFVAALNLLGAGGLTLSTTAQGTIVLTQGIYTFSGATIPAGVTVWCVPGASVVFRLDPTNPSSGTIFNIYGNLYNGFVDGQNGGFRGELIKLRPNGKVYNLRGYGFGGQLNYNTTAGNSSIISIRNSTNNYVQADLDDITCQDVSASVAGDNAPIIVHQSTGARLELKIRNVNGIGGANTQNCIGLNRNTDVRIENSVFDNIGGKFILLNGGNRGVLINNNVFNITQVYGSGIIESTPDTYAKNSTNTIISNNEFIHNAGGASNPIISLFNSTFITEGFVIQGNRAKSNGLSAPSFLGINAGVLNTIVRDNTVNGMVFIGDSGTGTLYTNMGNTSGNKQQ